MCATRSEMLADGFGSFVAAIGIVIFVITTQTTPTHNIVGKDVKIILSLCMGHAYHLWAIIRRLCLHTRSTRNSRVSNGERKWHSIIIAHSQLPFALDNVYIRERVISIDVKRFVCYVLVNGLLVWYYE